MALSRASDLAGGTYFKPADHSSALALLVEPLRLDKDVPYQPFDKTAPMSTRDELTANLTIFPNQDAVDGKVEPVILKGAVFTHSMLVGSLSKIIGDAMIGVIRRVPTKAGSGYAFRDADPGTDAKVTAYYEGRDAAVAAAIAEAPDDFDD